MLVDYGPRTQLRFVSEDVATGVRRLLRAIPDPEPSYVHAMGATRDHLLHFAYPLVAHPLAIRFSGEGFIAPFRWKPEQGTRVRAIHKDTGDLTLDVRAPPMFAFHHVGGRETEDGFEMVLAAHDDAAIVDALRLDPLRRRAPTPKATLRRVHLRPGHARVEPISDEAIELPRVHDGRLGGEVRLVWGTGNHDPTRYSDQLVRVDLGDGSVRRFRDPRSSPGEPVFVPRPGGRDEDDGVCLSMAIEEEAERSVVLVLDAATMTELARVRLPLHVPFHFHGVFLPDGSTGP